MTNILIMPYLNTEHCFMGLSHNVLTLQEKRKKGNIIIIYLPYLRMTKALRTPTAAFYAYMSNKENNPGRHHTIIFDHVITNYGNAYNQYTGIFTAPIPGLYVFSYAITADNEASIPVEVVKNAQVIGSSITYTSSNYRHNTASTVVIELSAGDSCFIRTSSTRSPSGHIYSGTNARSSLAGWLIS